MTARVTTLKGVDAGAYYIEALPSYYLDADEPPGRWHGQGADLLGLRGEVRDEDFLDVMAGVHPGSRRVLLGRTYGESSVRGFDITANAPKSVSVLFAVGDDFVRHEALASHDAAVAAMVGWIETHAHTRFRINGEVAVVDAEQTSELLDRLTNDAIAGRCVDISRPVLEGATLRRDGRPVTEAATDRALTTPTNC